MLGGFGSINHMIVTLRNNKNLLPKRWSYFKPNNYQIIKNEFYKATGNEFNIQKATPEQLQKIRNGIIQKRKKEARQFAIVICITLPLICFGIYKAFNNFDFGFPKLEEKMSKANIEKSNKDQYMFYINDGDNWISKRNYYNAAFQYKKALGLFPGDFEANYRLALAYSYRCQYDFEDCKIGMQLIRKLEEQFPNNQNIKNVKEIFVNWGE